MGAYIELSGDIKEKIDWITENGWVKGHGVKPIEGLVEIHWTYKVNDRRLMCLVDNGDFQAIAVAYNKELIEKYNKEDGRFKLWFTLDIGMIRSNMSSDTWKKYRDEIRKG